jgi:8-oxo-dGTP pyrophosphatase MutT (NUDIX family)
MKKLSKDILREHKGKSFVGVCTAIFCHDGKGRFFMAKRSRNCRDEHGRWDIGAGGLKQGQTAEENAIREAREEYGATVKKVDFLGYRDVFRPQGGITTHWVALDFALLVDPQTMKNNEPETFDEVGWFTLDNLPSPLHSQQKIFFGRYKLHLDRLGIR